MPQLDLTFFPSQIFWLFVIFSLLYLFVTFFLVPKISNIITLRNKIINENIIEAENLNKKIQDELQVHEQKLSDHKKNINEQIALEKSKIQLEYNKKIAQIDQNITASLEESEQQIDAYKASMDAKLDAIIIKNVVVIAKELVDLDITEDRAKKILQKWEHENGN